MAPRRVRIVEDNQDIAFMLGAMLQETRVNGAIEVEYTTSDFATLLAPEPWENIHIALCDLMLGAPVRGHDILHYLRDNHPQVRRVAMTAALTEGIEVTGLAERVLIKPFAVADVIEAIR